MNRRLGPLQHQAGHKAMTWSRIKAKERLVEVLMMKGNESAGLETRLHIDSALIAMFIAFKKTSNIVTSV